MDAKWKKLRLNPPVGWSENWETRKKIARFDTELEALNFQKLHQSDYEGGLSLDVHPKDGHVLYQEKSK